MPPDPVDEQQQEQQQQKSQDKQKSGDDSDEPDVSLGLINSTPIQVKTDLEQPVTSGGMDTMIENPGSRN